MLELIVLSMLPIPTGRGGRSPITYALIIINVAVYLVTSYSNAFLQISNQWLDFGSFIPVTLVETSQLYRLFTSMFMHADIFHIFFNMYFLYIFGKEVEATIGSLRYLTLYVASGISASIFHTAFAIIRGPVDLFIPAIGASGAISGVLGAYLMLYPQKRLGLCWFLFLMPWCFTTTAGFFLIFWFATQVIYGYMRLGGTAFFAHGGGFVAGILLLYTLAPRWLRGGEHAVAWDPWSSSYVYVRKRGLGPLWKGLLIALLIALLAGSAYSYAIAESVRSPIYVYNIETQRGGKLDLDTAIYCTAGNLILQPSSDNPRIAFNRLYWSGLLTGGSSSNGLVKGSGEPMPINEAWIIKAVVEGVQVRIYFSLSGFIEYDDAGVLKYLNGSLTTEVVNVFFLGFTTRVEKGDRITMDVLVEVQSIYNNIGDNIVRPAAITTAIILLPTTLIVARKDRELALT